MGPAELRPQSPNREAPGWKYAFRALGSRNYRLFFGGQTVSLIGTWMTRVAMSWLIYRLTNSAFLLGLVGFAGQIPALFVSPFAGVWVDRWDRHRTLLITQVLSMVQSFVLGILVLTGTAGIGAVIGLALFQGFVNAFDMPARQAFVVEMIENRADLGNAIALNSSMVNGARLIGPAIAGVVIAAVGEAWCFLIDGFSYIAVIASLLAMSVTPAPKQRRETQVLEEFREGWRYVAGSAAIRSILLLLALVSLVGMPYTVLMPIFAAQILGGGPHTLGFLMAASGFGALAAAVSLTLRRTILGLGRVIPASAALFGAALIAFSISKVLWLSMAMMFATGLGMMLQMASSNTILQTIVDEDKRGRVMAFYSMAFLGMAPFGSLLAGALAGRIGAPETLVFGGILCIAAAAWFARQLPALRSVVRPIYRRLGILPEVAAGIHAASGMQTPPEQ